MILLAGCDGDPDPRTLTLEVTGPSSAEVGEDVTLAATLRMFAPESLADESRLAIYVPDAEQFDGALTGPDVGALDGLGPPTTIPALENSDGELETLLDFLADDIPFGDQTLTASFTYRCEAPGAAQLYVDATFRGDGPTDRVNRVEMLDLTCAGDPLDAGPGEDRKSVV